MSHLTYYNYPGVGENNQKKFLYSQAVRIGAVQVKVRLLIQLPAGNSCRTNSCRAGMLISGGWVRETGEFFKEINAQIDQAFENCEVALKSAGGKGWSQVYRVNSYHVPINNEAMDAMVRNFKKWMPDHQPLWTCVGVPRLGEDDMRVEIEVWAHVPEGSD